VPRGLPIEGALFAGDAGRRLLLCNPVLFSHWRGVVLCHWSDDAPLGNCPFGCI